MPAARIPMQPTTVNASRHAPVALDRIWKKWLQQVHADAPVAASASPTQGAPDTASPVDFDAEAIFKKWIRDGHFESLIAAVDAQPAPDTPASRAEKLLLAHLSPEQQRQYRENGYILVPGRIHPQYRIRKGRVGNVDALDHQGRVLYRLCAHPVISVPDEDTMLAQVLMLNHHEQEFIDIANRHPGR